MEENPLQKLGTLGQSIWLDYIQRDLIESGELRRLIEKDKISGITSNPSIFEKAISSCHDYDNDVRAMALQRKNAGTIYEALSQQDVQRAADEFRFLYDATEGADGYVSLEVNPHLAYDAKGTLVEARRLWASLNRPNILIKLPATMEGLPVIRQLVSEGINVNVTLLFGIPRYRQVAESYIAGVEALSTRQTFTKAVTSVASFFVSRIDTFVDPLLEKIIAGGGEKAELAKILHGQIAVASAKMAYQTYKEIFNSARFRKLAARGACTQRLLWASTGTKNPEYSDVKYVDSIIGEDTVNTISIETLNAYRDHGEPGNRVEQNAVEAGWMLAKLPELGINIDEMTRQLEIEGVNKFNKSFDNLIAALEKASEKQNC
jgi:transaldolase